MKKVQGLYADAIIYTDLVEESAIEQIKKMCDQEFVTGCKIRIMPDVHSGAGCVIGFTADLGELVIPNIVGVDIGCGMLTVCLGETEIDFEKLDNTIKTFVPSGMSVHEESPESFSKINELLCYKKLKNIEWLENSLGTLGGGNHFIEIDEDDDNNLYLVIHTGSRNLGKQVAEYYQQLAYDILEGKYAFKEKRKNLINEYKATGRESELEKVLKEFNNQIVANNLPKELCYLVGDERSAYLHDMKICQEFAESNRKMIANQILNNMFQLSLDDFEWFETVHNYIDLKNNIIRKGAVSAQKDEVLLIPINMRDGSLICIGKGNDEWNYSAPHGAGRLFSRTEAKEKFSVDEFKDEMKTIYSSTVNENTIDECPMAYKPIESIIKNIDDTVDVVKIIRPVYNFKASE